MTPTRNSQDLETTLVDLLLLHGVKLRPSLFLTRCVVCNGVIVDVPSKERQATIFAQYGYPNFSDVLDVFQCSSCGQGYWWSESPNSSASRVKDLSTQLFTQCLRAGVPIEGPLDFFSFVNVEKEIAIGIEEGDNVSSMGIDAGGINEVVSWLKDKELGHSYHFHSVYENMAGSQLVQFTNVTFGFVGILDYIFYDTDNLEVTARLSLPLSFRQMNHKGISGGHLLPSDVWPSDHLAVGAEFRFKTKKNSVQEINTDICGVVAEQAEHGKKCTCGCVPPILSMFEMAELRRQYRLKQAGK